MKENNITKEFTFGEKLVGLSFNPSGDEKVNKIKELAAQMADLITDEKNNIDSSYLSNTFYGNSLRHILDAQMNCVKFLTNKY